MKQSEAWIFQAKSDFAAAQAVQVVPDDNQDGSVKDNFGTKSALSISGDKKAATHCQAIAKYQQVTEKSIKGMIRTLNEQGATNIYISTTQHRVYREMKDLDLSRRDRLRSDDKKWLEQTNSTLQGLKADIEWLSDLAPSGQRNGVFVKNTEYPFNDSSLDGWTAPAASGIYAPVDVTRAFNLAQKLLKQAEKFISAMRRRG